MRPFNGRMTEEEVKADQMAVLKLTGRRHAITCPLIAERGYATVCDCKAEYEEATDD